MSIYNIIVEDSTEEERERIDSEYIRLGLDENRNNLEENDKTIVRSEYTVDILHEENNNSIRIHEANVEKESHSDGNDNKIGENGRASSTNRFVIVSVKFYAY